MKLTFKEALAIGQVWESKMEIWMDKHFQNTDWAIEDTRDVYRDEDGDQYPDYILKSKVTGKVCFIDAKKRNAYEMNNDRYFGFDENFYKSYTNIANKHNTKVYVGFNDPAFDPDHVYVLDMSQEPSKVLYFNNKYGKGYAYRWNINDLLKYKI